MIFCVVLETRQKHHFLALSLLLYTVVACYGIVNHCVEQQVCVARMGWNMVVNPAPGVNQWNGPVD